MLISAVLTKRFVKKKKALFTEGNVCRNLFFVEKGAFRSFTTNSDGNDDVIQLALEDHWIADLSSFITQTPGTLSIDAIEDSEVWLLPYEAIEELSVKIPQLEVYFRRLYQRAYVSMQQRYHSRQTKSAMERYELLIHSNMKIAARIPLLHIASYLGITAESLSRIRKQLVKHK